MTKLTAKTIPTLLSAPRQNPSRTGFDTPWGYADSSETRGEGIIFYATPSHGGFHLDDDRNGKVDASWRNRNGWYEEDVEWAKVAFTFPDLFTSEERQSADRLLRDYHPDAYEKVTATKLPPGQSYQRDKDRFAEDHRDDWLVIAAINSDQQKGFVECIATRGGLRENGRINGNTPAKKRCLVPVAEYALRRHAFVIDPDRHLAYNGPSSFVTWRE